MADSQGQEKTKFNVSDLYKSYEQDIVHILEESTEVLSKIAKTPRNRTDKYKEEALLRQHNKLKEAEKCVMSSSLTESHCRLI